MAGKQERVTPHHLPNRKFIGPQPAHPYKEADFFKTTLFYYTPTRLGSNALYTLRLLNVLLLFLVDIQQSPSTTDRAPALVAWSQVISKDNGSCSLVYSLCLLQFLLLHNLEQLSPSTSTPPVKNNDRQRTPLPHFLEIVVFSLVIYPCPKVPNNTIEYEHTATKPRVAHKHPLLHFGMLNDIGTWYIVGGNTGRFQGGVVCISTLVIIMVIISIRYLSMHHLLVFSYFWFSSISAITTAFRSSKSL